MSLEFFRSPFGDLLMKVYSWETRDETQNMARPSLSLQWEPARSRFLLHSPNVQWARIELFRPLFRPPEVEIFDHRKHLVVPLMRSAIRDLDLADSFVTISRDRIYSQCRIPHVIPQEVAARSIFPGEEVDLGSGLTLRVERFSSGISLVILENREILLTQNLYSSKLEFITLNDGILPGTDLADLLMPPRLYCQFFDDGKMVQSDELDLFLAMGVGFPWNWTDREQAEAWAEEAASLCGV